MVYCGNTASHHICSMEPNWIVLQPHAQCRTVLSRFHPVSHPSTAPLPEHLSLIEEQKQIIIQLLHVFHLIWQEENSHQWMSENGGLYQQHTARWFLECLQWHTEPCPCNGSANITYPYACCLFCYMRVHSIIPISSTAYVDSQDGFGKQLARVWGETINNPNMHANVDKALVNVRECRVLCRLWRENNVMRWERVSLVMIPF